MRHRLPLLLAAALLIEVGTATGIVLGDARSGPARPAPVSRFTIGVSLPGQVDRASLDAWCRLVGARPAAVEWFQAWNEPIMYADQASAVRSTGIEPIVTWDPMTASGPINLPDIVAGQYDGYLRTSAQVVKAFARPVLIRFDHEMNLPNAGADPAIFVAAWRHVVNVFREVGAANAQFVWSPNVDCTGQCPFTSYFPGDPWVDWVGLDGYNAGSNNWQSLEAVFASSYRTLSRLTSRPMMIAETASAESGGSKATWIRTGLLDTVAGEFPRIRMVVWFDRLKERDWRVNSSPSALAAFRDVLQSPTVRATPATASGCGSEAAP